ncbi:MAG: alpha/beta hydrolase fold domain-containing protein [Verrucomicrobia bacterium]|nr:alpha/beta hydrolase fold domain-containing protein [Verrucomicrobiota bacterium]
MLRLVLLLSLTLSLRVAEPAVFPLWPEGVPGLLPGAAPEVIDGDQGRAVHYPYLAEFAPAVPNGTALVVCPGGGYVNLSLDNEGTKVAQRFNALGVRVFVLHYRLKEYGQPAPLRDVLRAIRLVRSSTADFGVDPNRIGVMGFSAGGHLAASAATLFDDPAGRTGAPLDAVSARPDFAVLIYPVITMDGSAITHAGSARALLGASPTDELRAHYSLERQVTARTPPVFLAHGQDDRSVPVENSLRFYAALRAAHVPAELHVWPHGSHGFGMHANAGPPAAWPELCAAWLRANHFLPAPAMTSIPKHPLPSTVLDWTKLPVHPTKIGERRELFDAPTATLSNLEGHVTTVHAGEIPHPAHQHPDEEMILVKSGTIEVTINGRTETVGPGSVCFISSRDPHGLRNPGPGDATYFVLRFVSPLTPAP